MNENLMNNNELEMMIEALNTQTQKLVTDMKQHPTDRQTVDKLVFSYNMYLSCIDIANKRNIKIDSVNSKALREIQEELIKHDILTEQDYINNGALNGRHL